MGSVPSVGDTVRWRSGSALVVVVRIRPTTSTAESVAARYAMRPRSTEKRYTSSLCHVTASRVSVTNEKRSNLDRIDRVWVGIDGELSSSGFEGGG